MLVQLILLIARVMIAFNIAVVNHKIYKCFSIYIYFHVYLLYNYYNTSIAVICLIYKSHTCYYETAIKRVPFLCCCYYFNITPNTQKFFSKLLYIALYTTYGYNKTFNIFFVYLCIIDKDR